ncbi:hypothetical protein SGRA_0930 [Saprospira grandis str. Lewin]|uniref:Uncharacterized protein n=1 Tax=Saprospira grandis (strain Lewin) TaxID=984262 RepID=H6L2K8_SAPGL|nr:hypothetical protein SGRA_0930 [Saprospira grandis str. Lewin]
METYIFLIKKGAKPKFCPFLGSSRRAAPQAEGWAAVAAGQT